MRLRAVLLLGLMWTLLFAPEREPASGSRAKTPAEQVLEYMAGRPEDGRREKIGFEKLTAMGAKAIDPIVRFYKKHRWWPWDPSRETAKLALECVATVRDRDALPRLMELAKERDRTVSLCAVYAIRAIAREQDVSDIIQLMDDDRFIWQARLGGLLGGLGGEKARKALCRYLKDRRCGARRGALIGLKALGDASLIPEILQAFESEKDPQVRIAAAETLASLGHETGGAYLAEVLEGDSLEYLLITAAYAAGRSRERKAVPGLIKLLGHEEWYFRDVAREALTLIGTKEARKAIAERLPKEEREYPLSSERKYFYSFDRDPFMDWDWELKE